MPESAVNHYRNDEVLLIDDEPNEVLVISVILKSAGINVRTFNDAQAGLQSVLSQPPSLVLLDWAMPGMSGLQICKTLNNNPATRGVPVVFCTGFSDTDSMLRGFDAGAVDFIRKPFSAEEVIARVKVHLDLRRTRLELERTVADLKKSEDEVRKSADRSRRLFENGNDAIFVHEVSDDGVPGNFTEVNETACTWLGYRRDELLRMSTADISAPESRHAIDENRRILHTTGRHIFERMLAARDGRRISVEINAHRFSIDGRTMIMAIARDMTERKKAEESLLKSERALKEAQRVGRIGSWQWEASTNIVRWSDELYRIYDMDPALSPADSETDQKLYTPESAARLTVVVQNAIKTGAPYVIELQRYITDGTLRWILARGEVVHDVDGRFSGLRGTAQDITDLKNAEDALHRSRSQLSLAVEIANLGPWEYDVLADMFTFNDFFYRIFHTTADAVGGYTMSSAEYTRRFVHPEDAARVGEEIYNAVMADDPSYCRRVEHRIIFHDGATGYICVLFYIVKDESGRTVRTFGANQDITAQRLAEEERRKIELQLNQSQKLESLGILAGGIAHDFNNLLGGIFGYMDLARDASDPNGKAAQYLSKSLKTYSRAKDLTQQLLTFAKGGVPTLKTGSVVSLLRDTTQFALSGSKVSCTFDIDEDLGAAVFDENQLGQVIDNIVINAVQAMPLGGALTVSAKTMNIARDESARLKEGKYLCCSFTDTGIGIPADILPSIFDPFFTTKQKGNGLGLATSFSIIQKHKGDITVDSIPGKGTTFHVFLPVSTKNTEQVKARAAQKHTGTGNVLIMDDEDYIREIVGEMVECMGYTAEYAADGKLALEMIGRANSAGHPFRAVIMDLTIPGGMGGKEAIADVRAQSKTLPVFVASGYSDDPVMADPAGYGFTDKISKPFRTEELRKLFSRHLKVRKSNLKQK